MGNAVYLSTMQATLTGVQSEALQARTECNQLGRELKARTLAARSLEVQLRQAGRQEQDDLTSRELDTLRAQLVGRCKATVAAFLVNAYTLIYSGTLYYGHLGDLVLYKEVPHF